MTDEVNENLEQENELNSTPENSENSQEEQATDAVENEAAAEETQAEEPEKTLTQTEVNAISAKLRREQYEKGYKKALEEQQQQQVSPEEAQAQAQRPLTVEEFERMQAINNHVSQIKKNDHAGMIKYKDEWTKNVKEFVDSTAYDDEARQILLEANQMTGAHDIIYRLAKNPSEIEKIKRINPKYWQEELIKLAVEPKVIRRNVAPAPVEDLKAPPARGSKPTYDDQLNEATRDMANW